MTRAGNSIYGPIDFNKFKSDIKERKRMLVSLNEVRQRTLKEKAQLLDKKHESFLNLKHYNDDYRQAILLLIVRIQRWFRAKLSKGFFKNLVKNDI